MPAIIETQNLAGMSAPGVNGVSRRTFLHALGALALSACGGGESTSPGTVVRTSAAATGKLAQTGSSAGSFVHPGLLHTQADFDRMAQKVAAQASPWIDSWNILIANGEASLSYTPNPQAVVSRGDDGTDPDNSAILFNDVAAAYQCALRWKISGNTAYADKAVQIMNAWSSTLTRIGGTNGANGDNDGLLLAGLQGYQFANAGEIMRTYAGWKAADFASFQAMMSNLFYPVNHGMLPEPLAVYSSWDLCAVASIMAIGVLCDDEALFNEAVTYFNSGTGNGAIAQTLYYIHPGYLGQTQESGRDQGHNTLSIALLGVICEMAWNQGTDLYGYANNRVLAGAEYVAKGNLLQSGSTYYAVPFAPYNGTAYDGSPINDTVFATAAQGTLRPIWALLYNHYVNRQGLAAPYTQKMMNLLSPEGGGGDYGPNSGGYDQLGFGTLTCTLNPIAQGAAPSGLTAGLVGGSVLLSWWGSAYATSYTVMRGTSSGGPYATVADGISDLLTYTDIGLPAATYYYVVTAQTASGSTTPASNEAVVIAAPQQLNTYLTFDASSGTVAADSSGNGNAGTLVGGASFVAGVKNNAVSLDGSTGYVSLPAGLVANLADFTIAMWVNVSQYGWVKRLFDFGSGTDRRMMFTPQLGGGGVACFGITVNGDPGMQYIQGSAPLPLDQWVHIAVTLSGQTGTYYLNGSVAGTNPAIWQSPFRLGDTTQNWIGRSQSPADGTFAGLVDDFRIYQGALTAGQVAALATS